MFSEQMCPRKTYGGQTAADAVLRLKSVSVSRIQPYKSAVGAEMTASQAEMGKAGVTALPFDTAAAGTIIRPLLMMHKTQR